MTTSAQVPGRLPVAINGHAYMAEAEIEQVTVDVIRQQSDTSPEAGEQTLNRQGLWLRSQESWHHGAGQEFLDGKQSDNPADPHRFRSSKGIDPWTRGQVSLHHPTLRIWSTTSTNLHMAVSVTPNVAPGIGGPIFLVWVADGTNLYYNALPFQMINTLALQQGTGWTLTNATKTTYGTIFTLTSTAGGAFSARSPAGTAGMPVDPGRQYGFVGRTWWTGGAGAGRAATVTITWYDSGGTTTGTPATATGAADTLTTTVSGIATAPAGAAFASIMVSFAASVATETHEILVQMAPYDDVSTLGYPDIWNDAIVNAGQPAQTVQSLATDGSYVWAAMGTSGLHRVDPTMLTTTADVPAAPAGGQISLVGYANGLTLAAGSAGTSATRRNTLWQVLDPAGVAPTLSLIKTHPNPAFAWEGIASGRACVYAFGNSGGSGEVYKVMLDPNTGALSTAASAATMLPDGETIHALTYYAGGIIMGTGRGVRLGQADGSGNIDYGPLIETEWPVKCLEPQDRYCWFGWTKYDATSSGLGRIDLGFLVDNLTPAWASDLMASGVTSGDVVSALTMAPYGYLSAQRPPVRIFSVAGQGVYVEDPGSRVLEGTLDTGTIRFSTSEPKTARSLDIRHHALPAGASIAAEIQFDGGIAWNTVGLPSSVTGSYGPETPRLVGDTIAEAMELRFTLDRPTVDGVDYSGTPELNRWTLKALPTPSTIDETFTIPILMESETLTGQGDGIPYHIDVPTEIEYLKGLERSRQIIEIQIGEEVIGDCYVAGHKFMPTKWGDGRKFLEGVYHLRVSTARG